MLARAPAAAGPAVHLSRSSSHGESRRSDGRRSSRGARAGARRHPPARWPASATDQWDAMSVCEDWTVRELVNHIVTGNYWADELAVGQDHRGGRRPARRRRARRRPAARLRRLGRVVAAAAFRAPGAMDAPCAVSYGPVPGSVYCGHRFIDVLVHGWDVAKSTGQDTTLDARPRRRRAGRWSSRSSTMLVGSGAFGTTVEVPDDADPQTQLLAVLGRQGVSSVVSRPMGQFITVTVQAGASPSVRIFDLNRSITGMAIERYPSVEKVEDGGPPARRARPAPVRPRRRHGHGVLELGGGRRAARAVGGARAEGDRDHRAPLRVLRRRRRVVARRAAGDRRRAVAHPRADRLTHLWRAAARDRRLTYRTHVRYRRPVHGLGRTSPTRRCGARAP